MAMKTPTNAPKTTETTETPTTTPTSTEVAAPASNALAALGNLQLFNIDPPKQSGDLLPAVKIVSPVEVDGVKFKGIDANQIGLYDGSKFEPLPAPFKIMVIAARKATRKLIIEVGPDGKEKKEYERGFAPMGAGFDASAALYEQHMNDNSAQKGISRIVAIIKDNGVVIAEFPTFLVSVDLWGPSLHQARDGRAALVKVSQLEAFLTPSKKNPLNKYIDPKKFNKTENVCNVELTREELIQVKEALEAVQDRFHAWCKR